MNSRKFNTQKVKETTGNLLFSIVLFILSFTIFSNSIIACLSSKTDLHFTSNTVRYSSEQKPSQVFLFDQSEIKEYEYEKKSNEIKYFHNNTNYIETSLILFIDKSINLNASKFIFETSQTPFYIMYCSLKSYLF